MNLPDSMKFVWMWFIELHNSRTSSGFGLNPIQYSEIKAYFELKGITPDEWEVQLIKRLDSIAMNHYAEEAKKEEQTQKSKSKSK